MSRNSILLTGLVGLVGAMVLTGLCLFVVARGLIPILVADGLFILGLLLFLLAFSLAEIPVMIIGVRRIGHSVNPRARYVALVVNAGYVFFGAVYAAPFILLTGRLGLGTALAALALVRFLSALLFLPEKKSETPTESGPAWG